MHYRRLVLCAVLAGGCRSAEERQQDAALHRLILWDQRRHLDSVLLKLGVAHGVDSLRLRAAYDSIAREVADAQRRVDADARP